jgi:hypothetical protein
MKMAKAPPKPKKIHKQIEHLKLILRSMNLEFAEEFRFHPVRIWRFDLAVPSLKLAIEYQGHGATGGGKHIGRHASVTGMSGDCEKENTAQAMGWKVLKFTALYFDAEKRRELKLTSPLDILTAASKSPLIEPTVQPEQPSLF